MKLLSTLALLLTITTAYAQPNLGTWQWANKEGGVENIFTNDNETVQDMCTDKYGNVYTTGVIYSYPYFGGVRYAPPFSSFGSSDAYVAKYDKCGHLKWVRFGGGIAQDQANAIHVDDSLNVYILGVLGSYNATFPDSNHTLAVPDPGLFWAKYDSLGNIKWVHVSNTGWGLPIAPSKLIPRPDGDLSTVIVMDTGYFYPGFSFIGAWGDGYGILKFDLNGNPTNIDPIDSFSYSAPNSALYFGDIAYDSKGNVIINYSIYDTVKLFDTILYSPSGDLRSFLLKANLQTNKIIWIKEWSQDQFGSSGFGSILVDKNDNIIADGSGGFDAVFNGDSIKFNSTAALDMEVCFKLDSNGNTLWYIVADNTNSSNTLVYPEPIALYGDQYICAPINVSGPTYWGGDTFNYTADQYVITFINTNTGKVDFGDTIDASNPNNSAILKVISDQQGNVYVGGFFSAALIAGSDVIAYTGGINDAFILKWGVPCAEDSTSLIPPQSAIDLVAYASGLHAIDVSWQNISQYANKYRIYRSATDSITGYSLIDSVSNSTVQYTDANVVANQIYWYRVSAVDNAGETFSNSDSAVIIPTGISTIPAPGTISLYPNPNKGSFILETTGSIGSEYTISDMLGNIIEQKTIISNTQAIDLPHATEGIYTIAVKGEQPVRFVIMR